MSMWLRLLPPYTQPASCQGHTALSLNCPHTRSCLQVLPYHHALTCLHVMPSAYALPLLYALPSCMPCALVCPTLMSCSARPCPHALPSCFVLPCSALPLDLALPSCLVLRNICFESTPHARHYLHTHCLPCSTCPPALPQPRSLAFISHCRAVAPATMSLQAASTTVFAFPPHPFHSVKIALCSGRLFVCTA